MGKVAVVYERAGLGSRLVLTERGMRDSLLLPEAEEVLGVRRPSVLVCATDCALACCMVAAASGESRGGEPDLLPAAEHKQEKQSELAHHTQQSAAEAKAAQTTVFRRALIA